MKGVAIRATEPNTLSSHFWKGITEIRLELLANPNDWVPMLTHRANEVVDRPDQLLLRGR
jgi:hypothetical protein